MASYGIGGVFITPSGGTNGATLDAWKASRFSGIPAQGQSPPAGGPDSASVSSGTGFGGPGSWQLYLPTNEQYYVRAQYSGVTYWGLSSQVTNVNGVAGGQVDSSIVDQGGQVFNVQSPLFGATGNGVSDDTAAIDGAITACNAAGGGTIFFPEGTYLITSGLSLPVTATQTAYLPGSPPIYLSNPIRMTGVMSGKNARGDLPTTGSIIKFDPSSAATFLTGYGSGAFEFDHMSILDASSQSNLFFRFTNTVSNIHDNLFCGNETFTSCWTDLVTYGVIGATTSNGGSNAIFNGYGTTLENNNLIQMRHLAVLCNGANAITIRGNIVANTCGTNNSDSLSAPLVLTSAIGNIIENNDFELSGGTTGDTSFSNGYEFGVYCANGSNNNIFKGNGFWDGQIQAIAAISFDNSCYGNVYVPGIAETYTGGYLPWGYGATGQQTSMGSAAPGEAIQPYVPIGGIIMWTAPTIPYGWFLCDGATFSAASYPALYAALGNSNVLPNFTNAFPYGTTGTGGGTGGSSTISLAQMPEHAHGPGAGAIDYLTGGNDGAEILTGPGGGYGDVVDTGYAGSGEAYLPPYIQVNFIMRGV